MIRKLACTILALAAADPALALAVQPVREVTVVDARNQRLGLYSTADHKVLMLLDRTLLAVGVDRDGFAGRWDAFFATPDCSGTPYVAANEAEPDANDLLLGMGLYRQSGSIIWVGDRENATTAIAIHSRGDGDGCLQQYNLLPPGTPMIPMTEAADLATMFSPPFRLVPK